MAELRSRPPQAAASATPGFVIKPAAVEQRAAALQLLGKELPVRPPLSFGRSSRTARRHPGCQEPSAPTAQPFLRASALAGQLGEYRVGQVEAALRASGVVPCDGHRRGRRDVLHGSHGQTRILWRTSKGGFGRLSRPECKEAHSAGNVIGLGASPGSSARLPGPPRKPGACTRSGIQAKRRLLGVSVQTLNQRSEVALRGAVNRLCSANSRAVCRGLSEGSRNPPCDRGPAKRADLAGRKLAYVARSNPENSSARSPAIDQSVLFDLRATARLLAGRLASTAATWSRPSGAPVVEPRPDSMFCQSASDFTRQASLRCPSIVPTLQIRLHAAIRLRGLTHARRMKKNLESTVD